MSLGLLIVQGVVLVPLYLRHIDSRLYGGWLATGNVASYIGMMDLGVSSVLLQRVSQAFGRRQSEQLGRIIGSGMGLAAVFSGAAVAVGVALSPWVPGLVHIHGPEARQLCDAFALNALATGLAIFVNGLSANLAGIQRLVVPGISAICATSIGIAMTIWMVIHGFGLMGIATGLAIRALLMLFSGGGYLFLVLRAQFPPGTIALDWRESRTTFRQALQVFSGDAAGVVASQSDALIVARVVDPSASTVLALTRKAADMVSLLAIRPSTSLLPALAHLAGEDQPARIRKYVRLLVKASIYAAALSSGGLAIFNESFVHLWVGDAFFGGQGLTLLICGVTLTTILAAALRTSVFALGEMVVVGRLGLLEAALRIVGGILLTRWMGINGAMLGALLAAAPISVLAQGTILARKLGIGFEVLPSLVKLVLRAGAPVLLAWGVAPRVRLQTMSTFAVGVATYASLVGICYIILDSEARSGLRRLLRIG